MSLLKRREASVVLPPIRQQPSPNFGERRHPAATDFLIVLHRPVGSYLGAIQTLCDPRPDEPRKRVSAHIVLGRPHPGAPIEATQLVGWSKTAWACAGFNDQSDNLEISDDAWNGRDPEAWKTAARVVAFRLRERGRKPRWARGGNGSGFCRHYDLGAAGGGHTDPTTSSLLWLRFVARVKFEYHRGGFRPSWGND